MNFRALGIAVAVGAASAWSTPVAASADQTMPTCAAGDTVVWENTSTKVYHLKGDKYFGNTKSGSYACKSAADAAGYHASGQKTKAAGSAGAPATEAPDAMTSPNATSSPLGKHHHKKKGVTSAASPAPDDTSSPSAMASPTGKHHHHKKGATPSVSPAADASPAASASGIPAGTPIPAAT